MESDNRKTGNMVQVWILATDINPVEAIKTGQDSRICGNCYHRGDETVGRKRTCYVNVGQAPNQVWKKFQRGNYPALKISEYAEVFAGRAIRLGAYGDPAVMPKRIVKALTRVATKHTGYTHQWRSSEWLKPFVMASCDSPSEYAEATSKGWRTFRVSSNTKALTGEIECLSDSQGITCEKCGLCAGTSKGTDVKNIFIQVHGSSASNFTILQ